MANDSALSQRFYSWFEQQIADWRPGTLLPSIRTLATEWGMSPTTVHRLLNRHILTGALVSVRGKGVFAGGLPSPPAILELRKSAVDLMAEHLHDRIRSGEIAEGDKLPPLKWLINNHRITPATAAGALRLLQQRSVVSRAGRYWYAGPFRMRHRSSRPRSIEFFRFGEGSFSGMFRTGRMAPAWWRMEEVLASHGFIVSYRDGDSFAGFARKASHGKLLPAGCILATLSHSEYVHIKPLLKHIQHLTGTGRFSMLLVTEAAPSRRAGVNVLNTGNIATTVTRELAKYCLRHRHRAVCILHDATAPGFYSFLALMKIRREIKRFDSQYRFSIALIGKEREVFRAELLQSYSGNYIDRFLRKYDDTVSLDDILSETTCFPDIGRATERNRMPRIWVCNSDSDAVLVARSLAARRISVPAKGAIITLQNDPAFFTESISACVPDWMNIGYNMAHSLIGALEPLKTTRGFLRVTARILDRSTT